jgi:hypothetical protein
MLLERSASGVVAIHPPLLPAGYEQIGEPQPLSPDPDGQWMVYAANVKHDVTGILIYDDEGVNDFLVSQVAVSLLFGLLDHLMDLANDCTTSFSDQHFDETYNLWHTWSRLQEPQPAAKPCCACWYEQNPGVPFPAEESSSLCERHRQRPQVKSKPGGHDAARA